jgi:hypothetical protein
MRNFHSYMGGYCQNCGNDLGYIEVDGGRTRRYCNDACRKAASRKRSKRDTALSRNESFLGLWDENGIKGEVRERLINILTKYGRDACLIATEAVITAKKEVDSRYMSLYSYKGLADELERLKQSHFDLMYKHSQLRTEKERLERRLARETQKDGV